MRLAQISENKIPPNGRPMCLARMFAKNEKPGAGEGIRTLDPDLGKVVLYP
jgi:hypothetical protein